MKDGHELDGQAVHEFEQSKKYVKELLDDILNTGLIVVGVRNAGKTVSTMHIVRAFMEKRPDVRVNIFDTCLNWRWKFDKIPFTMMDTTIQSMPSLQHLLVDVPFASPKETRMAISAIALKDFGIKASMKEQVSDIPYWNLYVIEEIQNVFGSHALKGFEGEFWLKLVSEGRNFGMGYIGLGQRLASISTEVVERAKGYLLGNLTGDNCLKKVQRIGGVNGKRLKEVVKNLPQGKFVHICADRVRKFSFPSFKQKGKPYKYEQEEGNAQEIRVEDLSWLLKQ